MIPEAATFVDGEHEVMRADMGTWELFAIGLAALCGFAHGVPSLLWGLGWTVLLDTVNDDIVAGFAGRESLLLVVAGVKLAAALLPVWWALRGWPVPGLTRGICWVGSAVLMVWGGGSAAWAQLVLAGIVEPEEFDRTALIGNAFIWDPLFFAWGLALASALMLSRMRTGTRRVAEI